LALLRRPEPEHRQSPQDLFHALLHGVRHWAQLSTYLRQKGYKQDWQHDFIFSGVMR
jgi:uncharacterized damage-inducible protein DinB